MTIKKKKISLLCLILSFCTVTISAFVLLNGISVGAQNEQPASEAYFLSEDRGTLGFWYTGDKAFYYTEENGEQIYHTDNRIYGKEGAFITYHKITGHNTNPVKDMAEILDMSEESRVHFAEYPSWIKGVTTNIDSYNGGPYGYWNYIEENTNGKLSAGHDLTQGHKEAVRSVDPSVWNTKLVAQDCAQGTIKYRYTVNDNEWHRVSVFLGDPNPNKQAWTDKSHVYILDGEENVLVYREVKEVNKYPWLTFAVRGDFTIAVQTDSAASRSAIAGVWFDADYKNESIIATGLNAELDGIKKVKLSWNNKTNDSYTAVYRKEVKETYWTRIAVVNPGVSSYIDEDSEVSCEYEYKIASGLIRNIEGAVMTTPNVIDFNVPNGEEIVSVKTPQYKATKVVLDKPDYYVEYGRKLVVKVNVYKEGADGQINVPHDGAVVRFSLGGDLAYDTRTSITPTPNMQTDLGKVITNDKGMAYLEYEQPYAGEYELNINVDICQDPLDPMSGYDGTSVTTLFVQNSEDSEKSAPVLLRVSEAVKPGDSVLISGGFISDEGFLLAYAPHTGKQSQAFDETSEPEGIKYLTAQEVTSIDDVYGTGVSFVFPENEKAGMYDFWVRNEYGWSKSITMNAPRALFLCQESAYEGLKIEVVGRNFFGSEYGVIGDDYKNLKIKLDRVSDLNGVKDGIEESVTVPVISGERYSVSESYVGMAIDESNPYRITFIMPRVSHYGKYKVSVTTDGYDFRELEEPGQYLEVCRKKIQVWNEKIFGKVGSGNHVGNDPLDLGVAWAQDLNYTNFRIFYPNAEPGAGITDNNGDNDAMRAVQSHSDKFNALVSELSKEGGGVLYLPAGKYYLTGNDWNPLKMLNNVIVVGEGKGKTIVYFTNGADNYAWFINAASQSNIGFARLTFSVYKYTLNNTDRYLEFVERDSSGKDIPGSEFTSKNHFLKDVDFKMPDNKKGRGLILFSLLKNLVVENVNFFGSAMGIAACPKYYGSVRNCYLDIWGYGIAGEGKRNGSSAPAIQGTYSVLENTYLKMDYGGHGWSMRNNIYAANNYVTGTGSRDSDSNQNNGEILLIEPPNGYFSYGNILSADSRSATVALTSGGGKNISAETEAAYNRFALFIYGGKGAGQLRYISNDPIDGADGKNYGNTFRFLDGERDWDIIPDSTSRYTLINPLNGITVYRTVAEDCAKNICAFYCVFDTVIAENDLKDTAGISLTASQNPATGMLAPGYNVRITNNKIDGLSPKSKVGGVNLYMGAVQSLEGSVGFGVTVSNNRITNTRVLDGVFYSPFGSSGNGFVCPQGISIYSGVTEGTASHRPAKFMIVENNYIDNSEYGVYFDSQMSHVIIRNNTIGKVKSEDKITYYGAPSTITAKHDLYVNGVLQSYSGEYHLGDKLPVPDAPEGTSFWGWSLTETYTEGSEPIKLAQGDNVTLYALFGHTVRFDNNYAIGGKNRGTYLEIGYIGDQTIDKSGDIGTPFRVGYQFGGWYTDEGCTVALVTDNPLESNVTAYAKWIPEGEEIVKPSEGNKSGISPIAFWSVLIIIAVVSVFLTIVVIKKIIKELRKNP